MKRRLNRKHLPRVDLLFEDYLLALLAVVVACLFMLISVFLVDLKEISAALKEGEMSTARAIVLALLEVGASALTNVAATAAIFAAVWYFIRRVRKSDEDDSQSSVESYDVEMMEAIIKAGNARELKGSSIYNAQFQKLLKNTKHTIHIAVLTTDAFEYYEEYGTKQKWDGAGPMPNGRRRIAIVNSELLGRAEYHQHLNNVVRFFDSTAETILARDTQVLQHEKMAFAMKDSAVFFEEIPNTQEKWSVRLAHVSYIPANSHLRFTRSPSGYYEVHDVPFCQKLADAFEQIWSDADIIAASVALRKDYRIAMNGGVPELPPEPTGQ